MREKVGKSRNTVFFQWFGAPDGRKVGSKIGGCGASWPDERWKVARCCGAKQISKSKCTKHTSSGPLLEVEMSKKCTPLARSTFPSQNVQSTPFSDHFWKLRCQKSARRWREAHFQVKMYKTHHSRTTFGSSDVEKVHAVVARSTFPSQNVQNTPASDHFWKFRCRKSARRCGAKHISKSKCTKHTILGPLLEVQMSKKCTPLWVRSTFPSQNVQNTTCSRHFWRFGCWKSARRCGAKHISKSKCTKHHMFAPLLEVRMSLRRFASLHYVTLHHTPLYYTTLRYTTLHNTTTTTTQLDYTPLHSTTLNFTTLHYTTLRFTTLHYIELHHTPLHYITLHYAPQHYNYNYTTTLHYTPLH